MAGHGSLCRSLARSRVIASTAGWFCALMMTSAPAQDPKTIDLRLRIQWQAPTSCYWKTQLELIDEQVDGTSISEVVSCGESRLQGSITLTDPPNKLLIQPRFSQTGGTVELRIRGNRDAKLSLHVARIPTNMNSSLDHLPSRELTLAELATLGEVKSHNQEHPDSNQPTWSLSRLPGDSLRTEDLPADETVAPGQELQYKVRCNSMLQYASQRLTLHASLIRVDDGKTMSTSRHILQVDASGNSEPTAIDVTAPQRIGVYEVRSIVVKEDENIWSRIRRRDLPLVQSGCPLIVQSADHQPNSSRATQPAWEIVGELRPSEPVWSVSTWIPQSTPRFIPRPGTEPEQLALTSEPYADQTVSILAPKAVFQTTLPILRPSMPHRIKLRLTQDRPIHLRVQFGTSEGNTRSFLIMQDSPANPESPWLEYTWLHYPGTNEQLTLTNLGSENAAIDSVLVEAGPAELPTLSPSLEHDFAFAKREAVLRIADKNWVENWSVNTPLGRNDFDETTITAQQIWISCSRLAEYAHQMSLNGVMLPAETEKEISGRLPAADPVQLSLSLLTNKSLRIYVAVRPTALVTELEDILRLEPNRVGELTRDETNRSEQYDLLDPTVQRALANWIGDLDARYQQHRHFAGLGLVADDGTHLQSPKRAYDTASTIARFAESANISDDLLDEESKRKLAQSDAFDQWLRTETVRAYSVITSSLTERPALILLPVTHLIDLPLETQVNWKWAPVTRDGNGQILSDRQLLAHQISTLSATNPPAIGAVLIEATSASPNQGELRSDWESELSQVINRLEPEILLIDQSVTCGQLSDELKDLFTSFTSLPKTPMKDIPGTDPAAQTVHVKTTRVNGRLYVTLTSGVPWPSDVDLETSEPTSWESGLPSLLEPRSENRIRVTVPAGQIIVLWTSTPSSKTLNLTGWTSRVGGGIQTLQRIKQQVTTIVERLGTLSDLEPNGQPRNGGFEQAGQMGLVGWLHAQHPPNCVRVDDRESASGKQSIRLTTDPKSPSRTWLVSETIDPPPSGRLAVSLTCRSEQQNDAPPHRLKVSIEASRNGYPIRFATEFEVPRNGKWNEQHAILEAEGIHRGKIDSLRLTIDSLSTGQVWIDDVRLHDRFATQREREELQSLAFLAVQGLQRSNLAPSGRLLQNPWARHLLNLNQLNPPNHQSDSGHPPAEAPGVAERLRTWLPSPLRF